MVIGRVGIGTIESTLGFGATLTHGIVPIFIGTIGMLSIIGTPLALGIVVGVGIIGDTTHSGTMVGAGIAGTMAGTAVGLLRAGVAVIGTPQGAQGLIGQHP